MGVSKQDERRKYSRVGFTTKIDVILRVDGKDVALGANSKDLSQKGIFAHTETPVPLNTPCTVNVYLSGGVEEIKLEIQGRSVRQTDTGVGIVFESMDVDTYTHLKNIVRYNSDGTD